MIRYVSHVTSLAWSYSILDNWFSIIDIGEAAHMNYYNTALILSWVINTTTHIVLLFYELISQWWLYYMSYKYDPSYRHITTPVCHIAVRPVGLTTQISHAWSDSKGVVIF